MPETNLNETENPFPRRETKANKFRWVYYAKPYAEAVAKILDKLHNSGNPSMRIPAQDKSINTLKLQYYHGVHYLIDHLDPDGKYLSLYQKTRCHMLADEKCLELVIIMSDGLLTATPVMGMTDWKQDIMEFIEKATIGSKYQKIMQLTENDRLWVRSQLEPFGDQFLWQITDRELTIIRDNPS